METTHPTHPFLSDMETLRARARDAMEQGGVAGLLSDPRLKDDGAAHAAGR